LEIVHDNGRDNFLLEIKDLNSATIEGGGNIPEYSPKAGCSANIMVDFKNGVSNLAQPLYYGLYLKRTPKCKLIAKYQM
jgi:hypothetical protein